MTASAGSDPATPAPPSAGTGPRPLLALTLPELWAFLAVALPVVAALLAPLSTVDLAYQVRAGQLMVDQGAILRADPFTFTAAGLPWLNQQWGAQLVLGTLYDIGGWGLLAALRALLVGIVFGLTYRSCRDGGASRRAAAWLTLAGFGVSAVALGMRPQLVGMALFALTVWLVAGRRRDPRRLWLVPLIVVAWANLHGSFFLGPAVLGFAWLQDRWDRVARADRTLAVALVSVAATAANPWGFGVWQYAVGLTLDPTIRQLVTEWEVTTPLMFVGAVFYLSVAGAALALVIRWPSPVPWPALVWLAGLVAIGIYAQRGVVWWALGAPPALAVVLFTRTRADGAVAAVSRAERRSVVNGVLALAIVVAGTLALPWWRAAAPAEGPLPLLADAPTRITQVVQVLATPADRLFVPQPLGSWFELAVPQAPVFVDSRIELFPTTTWDDYLAVSSGQPGWRAILDRWSVTIVVVVPDEQPGLLRGLRGDAAWRIAHEDDDGLVFERA